MRKLDGVEPQIQFGVHVATGPSWQRARRSRRPATEILAPCHRLRRVPLSLGAAVGTCLTTTNIIDSNATRESVSKRTTSQEDQLDLEAERWQLPVWVEPVALYSLESGEELPHVGKPRSHQVERRRSAGMT